MCVRRIGLIGICGFLVTTAVFAGSSPLAVSPGDPSKLVLIGNACPTFSWGAVSGATGYELMVYSLGDHGDEALPVVMQSFVGSVFGWTPSLDGCLKRGGRYAWTVRATGLENPSHWSAPSLFQVAIGPSAAEFEAALQVVRRYLDVGDRDVRQSGGADDGRVEAESEPAASVSSPVPAAVGTTQLSVEGGVVATSFTGDGSTLTSLDPANLTAGTAGISISGNAATATNADTLDTLDSTAFATAGALTEHVADIANPHAVSLEQITLTTAKGDLLVEDGADVVRLPVGSDGQVLVADSSQSEGVTWATVADACPVCSAPALVQKTGQTTSYDNRDDGELERGVPWPNPRFTDNTDGTVTDNLTGLIWLKDASCDALPGTDPSGGGDWPTAVTAANLVADGICGLTDNSAAGDWRLPNLRELHSLVHYEVTSPALPNTAGTGQWTEGDAFSGVVSGLYWSSSTRVDRTDNAWGVYFMTGDTFSSSKDAPNNTYYVWPIRGGQ